MKNLSICLFLVAIVSLLCLCAFDEFYLVTPDNAIAQMPDPVPCCYNLPSIQNPYANDGLQSTIALNTRSGDAMASIHPLYLGGQLASSLAKGLELEVSMQFGTESQISFAETGILNAFSVKDREIYYGQPT
jgi:hypothetical protein